MGGEPPNPPSSGRQWMGCIRCHAWKRKQSSNIPLDVDLQEKKTNVKCVILILVRAKNLSINQSVKFVQHLL